MTMTNLDFTTMTFTELKKYIHRLSVDTDISILKTTCDCGCSVCRQPTIAHVMAGNGYKFPDDRMDILTIGADNPKLYSVATHMVNSGHYFSEDNKDILFIGSEYSTKTPAMAMAFNGYQFSLYNRDILLHSVQMEDNVSFSVATLMAFGGYMFPLWDDEIMRTYAERIDEDGQLLRRYTLVLCINPSNISELTRLNKLNEPVEEVYVKNNHGEWILCETMNALEYLIQKKAYIPDMSDREMLLTAINSDETTPLHALVRSGNWHLIDKMDLELLSVKANGDAVIHLIACRASNLDGFHPDALSLLNADGLSALELFKENQDSSLESRLNTFERFMNDQMSPDKTSEITKLMIH